MTKISRVKRAFCVLFAVLMTVSCVMTARAGEIITYKGDSNTGKCAFSVSTPGADIKFTVTLPNGTVRSGSTKATVSRTYDIGSVVKMTANDYAQGKFLYWFDNATKRIFTTQNEVSYVLGTKVNYRAQACPVTGDKVVTYASYGGTILKSAELASNEGLSAPVSPALPGLTFKKWSMTEQEIANSTENSIVYPVYSVNEENYTVAITNTEYVQGAGTYPVYGTAVLKAEPVNGSGESFSYWKDSKGNIVSYSKDYSFRVNYNETFTAVYGEDVTAEPVIRITKIVPDVDESTITFFAERWVPEDMEVINHGMLITADESKTESQLVLGNAGDTNMSAILKGIGKSNENVGTYSLAKSPVRNATVMARPYVVYLDNGTIKVLYGDTVTGNVMD